MVRFRPLLDFGGETDAALECDRVRAISMVPGDAGVAHVTRW